MSERRASASAADRALRGAAVRVLATILAFMAPLSSLAADAPASRVPRPAIVTPAGGTCVEDTATMRRVHMDLIRHQRDATVREGIRTTRHSLANCVNCHAGKETGRVTGAKDAFCEGCHRYAGVALDCFECHTDRAAAKVSARTTGAPR